MRVPDRNPLENRFEQNISADFSPKDCEKPPALTPLRRNDEDFRDRFYRR
jgi:hypothetical protein